MQAGAWLGLALMVPRPERRRVTLKSGLIVAIELPAPLAAVHARFGVMTSLGLPAHVTILFRSLQWRHQTMGFYEEGPRRQGLGISWECDRGTIRDRRVAESVEQRSSFYGPLRSREGLGL